MSIRIIPQDELGSSEKRTADMIPPLLFPRLKNLYNRRAERLRELAENNPLGDFLRFNGREVLENFGTVRRLPALCRADCPCPGSSAVRPSAGDGSDRAH